MFSNLDYPDSMDIDYFHSQEFESYVPKFNCMGRVGHSEDILHEKGYVCSGEIDRILQDRDPIPWLFPAQQIKLFNKCFIFDEAFFNDIDTLLKLAKLLYSRLEFEARSNQLQRQGSPPSDLREKLTEFFSYIRVYTHRFLKNIGRDDHFVIFQKTLLKIIEELNSLSCNVTDMPRIVFSEGSLNNNSATANFFHVYFDLRWTLIETCFMACEIRNFSDSNRSDRERLLVILTQLQEQLCTDLIYIAAKLFSDVNANEWPVTNPFNCTCIREMWLMLRLMTERDKNFFPLIQRTNQTMQEIRDRATVMSISDFQEIRRLPLPAKDSASFIWLCVHLAKLGGFNSTGYWNQDHFSRLEPSYEFFNRIVQSYLNSGEGNEDRMRGLMGSLYSLTQAWGPNLNLCIMLWEHFSRKLDDQFSSGHGTFDTMPYSSCLNWYEHLTCNVEPWKPLTTRYNSYFLFLRLLGYHMELMNSKSQASMKARIYVKLHGKKLLELSQLGLYHLISACLIVVLTSEASDMCNKILEMSTNVSPKSSGLISVAEMVLLLISIRRGTECHAVAESVAGQLDRAARCLNDSDIHIRDEQRHLGQLFIDGLNEVAVHCKNFNLGPIKLIGIPLRNYLKSCGSCQRSSLVEVLSNMIRNRRRMTTTSPDEVYQALMAHIFPLMKEKYAQIEFVSFFSEMALTSLEHGGPEFTQHLNFFCLDEKVQPKFSAKFLRTLLDHPSFLINLSMQMDNYQSFLIQTWFRLSFLLPSVSECAQEVEMLTSVVRRLPRIAELCVKSKVKAAKSNDFLLEFIQMISAVHQSIPNHNERVAHRDVLLQYLGPLDKYLTESQLLTQWEPSSQVHHVIRLCSDLFFHCGNVIYTKGKADCLLAQLNNILLIPIGFYDLSKELPSTASAALFQHLPMYVFGLFRLNPLREPYVSRCLTGIFQVYMNRYPPNESHPFTKCWTGLEIEPITESLVPFVRTWFLQYISTNILPFKTAKTSPFLAPSLQWLKYLSSKHDWKVEIMQVILLPILELALSLEEISGKRSVTEYLQISLTGQDPDELRISGKSLNELIGRHFAFNSNRLFKLIEVICVLNAPLVKQMVPVLRDQVLATEAKRGTGVDLTLRQQMEKLEITLGISKS